jgi:hypothetical protein
MNNVLMTGRAQWKSNIFDFKLGPWCDGIGLLVRDTAAGDKGFNGAGIWPSIEKAKSIAEQIAKRAMDPDCVVVWTEGERGIDSGLTS